MFSVSRSGHLPLTCLGIINDAQWLKLCKQACKHMIHITCESVTKPAEVGSRLCHGICFVARVGKRALRQAALSHKLATSSLTLLPTYEHLPTPTQNEGRRCRRAVLHPRGRGRRGVCSCPCKSCAWFNLGQKRRLGRLLGWVWTAEPLVGCMHAQCR